MIFERGYLVRHWECSRTLEPVLANRTHTHLNVILRKQNGDLVDVANRDDLLPLRDVTLPPDDFIVIDIRICSPCQCRVVGQDARVDQEVFGCSRSLCKGPDGSTIDLSNAGGEVDVDEFDEVAKLYAVNKTGVLVLVGEVLMRLCEANSWESLLQERFSELFGATFSRKKNEKFETSVRKAVNEGKWKRVVGLWKESVKMAQERYKAKQQGTSR